MPIKEDYKMVSLIRGAINMHSKSFCCSLNRISLAVEMARNMITSTVTVPDVLSGSNYKEWSNCMRNYLLAQNLWDVVEPSNKQSIDQEGNANWKRKNAAVLHALQISCAPEIFAWIMGKTSAKEAWEHLVKINEMNAWHELARMYEIKYKWHLDGPQSSSQGSELHKFFEGTIPGKTEEHIERNRSNKFLVAIFDRNWDAVMKLLDECRPHEKSQKFCGQVTLLHFGVASRDLEVVKKLVQIMSEEEILCQDEYGNTALALAAYIGATDIAEWLTLKNKKLLTIPDREGMIPVVRACFQRCKDTTLYLYFQTLEFLDLKEGEHGSLLLHFCILNEMLDIALDLLRKCPRLVFTGFKYNNQVSTPFLTLSTQTSLFPSGTRLSFLQQWVYYGISVASEDKEVKRPPAPSTDVRISITSIHQNEQNDINKQELSRLQRGLSLFFLGIRGFSSMLQRFLGIKYIYERKLIHACAFDILHFAADHLSSLNAEEVVKSRVVPALFQSIQHGILEFSDIGKTNPDLMLCPIDRRTMITPTYAIQCRQEKFFREVSSREGHTLATWTDDDGNNALHTAAKLGPESYLAQFSGAALQMQKELQWFKEFESVVPECKGWVNHNGETPWQVFCSDHMNLLKEAEAWMKQTAKSYIIVGALILTIMFAAAFTIPGGNNDNGFPMFLHKRLFMTYVTSDAISLFTASTSVLAFLGILTFRYTEEDFHKSLPTMLIIGILTLLISVATMMVAFCAAVSIMLGERWWVVFSLVLLASIPVVVFLSSQSRLLFKILHSTYGPGIFNRKSFSIREKILSIMRKFTSKLMKRRE